MSLPPPPPPMMTNMVKGNEPSSLSSPTDYTRKCFEMSRISKDEAIMQIKQIATVELERIGIRTDVPAVVDEEPLGMLILMTPILEPILQCGPVCGLIALVEAAQILKSKLAPDIIFAEARRLGITRNGEMFSSESMQMLIKESLHCDSRILDTRNDDTVKELGKLCLQGKPALIPYDADYNHGPSLRKGHAAHWAVIHGLALPIHVSKLAELTKAGWSPEEIVVLEPQQLPSFPGLADKIIEFLTTDVPYVIAHQGKSLRAAIWKYSDLIKSNQNLYEVSPKLTSNPEEYVLGNIELGLCSKLVTVE